MISSGAALSVMMDCQKTLKKVARVKAKEMKPMTMEAREMGARTEWEIVTPIGKTESSKSERGLEAGVG